MIGAAGQELIKQLRQNTSDFLPPYSAALVQAVVEEMRTLFDANRAQVYVCECRCPASCLTSVPVTPVTATRTT